MVVFIAIVVSDCVIGTVVLDISTVVLLAFVNGGVSYVEVELLDITSGVVADDVRDVCIVIVVLIDSVAFGVVCGSVVFNDGTEVAFFVVVVFGLEVEVVTFTVACDVEFKVVTLVVVFEVELVTLIGEFEAVTMVVVSGVEYIDI